VQTTERYLGCKQNLGHPVNDLFDLGADPTAHESNPQPAASSSLETVPRQELECPRGGSEDDDQILFCQPAQRSQPERTEVVQVGTGDRPEAFDRALNQELQEVIQRAKKMAAEIKVPSELWELEHHLTQRRKEIDRKYEYRASKLTLVFGTLLHERRLTEHDLRGLHEDKLEAIRSYADFLAKIDVGA
jgi:hypothetical protein